MPSGKWWEVLADGDQRAALFASGMSNWWPCESTSVMGYAPELERVNGVAPSSQPWQSRILLLNHTRAGSPVGFPPTT